MATCKVIRNTNNREIETVLVDRPLDRDLTTLISSYYESQGIPVVMDKQAMFDRLKELGYNVDAQIVGVIGAQRLSDAAERINNLEVAKDMFNKGVDYNKIWIATGWQYDNVDNKWKSEIEDRKINPLLNLKEIERRLIENPNHTVDLPLNILYSSVVFDAYPELQDITIKFTDRLDGVAATPEGEPIIFVNVYTTKEELQKSLLHELHHKISEIEGFSRGADRNAILREYLSDFISGGGTRVLTRPLYEEVLRRADRDYFYNNGEFGARIVEERYDLPQTIKSKTLLLDDVSEDDRVYINKVLPTLVNPARFLSDDETVYGFVDPNGTIYIDPELANTNTLLHEGAHIQMRVLRTAAAKGDTKAQAVLDKIRSITSPIVDRLVVNSPTTTQYGANDVDMQAEQGITRKVPELTALADSNIELIKNYDRYQRIKKKQAEGARVLKTDQQFLQNNPHISTDPIINLGTPSDILKSVGITRPIEMSLANLRAHIVGKPTHEITTLDLVDIMRGIHNPALVNKARDGKVQLLINKKNSNGAPIVVILNNDYKLKNGDRVANITTAYSLTNSLKVVPNTPGDVLYVNRKKLAEFLSDFSESINRGFGKSLLVYPEYDSLTDTIKYQQSNIDSENEFDSTNIRKIIENTKNITNKTNVRHVDFQIIGEQGAQRVQQYAEDTPTNLPISTVYQQRPNETDAQYRNRLEEEVFARLVGDNAEQYLKDLGLNKQQVKSFLDRIKEFIEFFIDWLKSKPGFRDLSDTEIEQLSIKEFLTRSTSSMLLGEFNPAAVDLLRGEVVKFENKAQEYFTREADRLPLTLAVFNTKPFQDLQGKQVNPITIQQLLNKTGIKQIEKDLINQVLSDNYSGQKRIDYDEFEATVRANIMPLERIFTSSYANYGMDNLGSGNYGEANTIILNAPIEHGVTGHFSGAFKASGRKNIKYVPKQLNDNTWVAVEEGYESQANNNNIYQFVGTAGTKEAVESWIENHENPLKYDVNNTTFIDGELKGKDGNLLSFFGDISHEDAIKNYNKEQPLNEAINKGMFGHIRVWQDGQTFYVAELQSDYFQKNNARKNILDVKLSEEDYKKLNENRKKSNIKLFKELGYVLTEGVDQFTISHNGAIIRQITPSAYNTKIEAEYFFEDYLRGIPQIILNIDNLPPNFTFNRDTQRAGVNYVVYQLKGKNGEVLAEGRDRQETVDNYRKQESKKLLEATEKSDSLFNKERNKLIQKIEEEEYKKLSPQERQFIASQKIWEQRMAREAIKEASLSGATSLRFPTPYTFSVIEGYVSEDGNLPYDTNGITDRDLEPGDVIDYGGIDYTVIEADGSIITVAESSKVYSSNIDYFINEEVNYRTEETMNNELGFETQNAFYTLEEWEDIKNSNSTYYLFQDMGLEDIADEKEGGVYEINDEKVEDIVREAYQDSYSDISQLLDEMGYENIFISGDTVYFTEYRANTETLGQPDSYDRSSKDDFTIEDSLDDTQQTVARKYEEIAEILKQERGEENVEIVTDENGFDWYETKITPEGSQNPVVAFQINATEQELQQINPATYNIGTFDPQNNDIRFNIEQNETRINRLPPTAEQGRIEGGRANVEATIIAREISRKYSKSERSSASNKEEQAEAIKQYAKDSGIWFEEGHNFGQAVGRGNESTIYKKTAKSKNVTKIINPYAHSIDMLEFFDRVSIHNGLFPDTALTIEGFTEEFRQETGNKGDIRVVMTQRAIDFRQPLTMEQIREFLESLGFEYVNDYLYKSDYYILEDTHEENIVLGTDGRIYVLDLNYYLNTPDDNYGGVQRFRDEVLLSVEVEQIFEPNITPTTIESQTYKQLLSIPGVTKEEALTMYKHLYSQDTIDWENLDNLSCEL